MEWAEDLFTLKKSAKKGRRAGGGTDALPNSGSSNSAAGDTKPGSGTSITSIADSLDIDQLSIQQRPPPRRTTGAGWADEPIKSAGSKSSATNAIEQERFGRIPAAINSTTTFIPLSRRHRTGADDFNIDDDLDGDDIPVIPDMDGGGDRIDYSPSSTSATVHVRSTSSTTSGADDHLLDTSAGVSVKRVATYQELNADLLKMGAFASLDGVDLSILTRCLAAEAELHEPDEVWTWDGLFTELAGEIHGEEQQRQQHRQTAATAVAASTAR